MGNLARKVKSEQGESLPPFSLSASRSVPLWISVDTTKEIAIHGRDGGFSVNVPLHDSMDIAKEQVRSRIGQEVIVNDSICGLRQGIICRVEYENGDEDETFYALKIKMERRKSRILPLRYEHLVDLRVPLYDPSEAKTKTHVYLVA